MTKAVFEDLRGRVIIVTGAASGVGAACAKALLAAGVRAVLVARTEGAMRTRLAEWRAPETDMLVVGVDLECEDAAKIVSERTLARFGRIDGLVNNAAIFSRSTIDTDALSQFDKVFHVNVRTPLMLTQALVRDCRRRKASGVIVNIGSINAHCGAEFILIYSMSKGALMTMTRNLADALGAEKIRVNQLNLGWILTEGENAIQKANGGPDDWHEHVSAAAAPRGKLTMPEEVANHILFWLSDASAPASGSVCEVEQYPVIGRNQSAG